MIVGLIDLAYTAIAIPLSRVVSHVVGWFDQRWRQWARDRSRWQQLIGRLPNGTRLWFHAASMGEFEQLVPIIDRLRTHVANPVVVVTITSLSGIDHARSTPGVDVALLLPTDARGVMRSLVRRISPTLCVIDRYDLWRNMVLALDQAQVPIALVNGTEPSASTIPLVRTWLSDTYSRLEMATAVTPEDAARLQAFSPHLIVESLPDTRMDRVLDRVAARSRSFENLRSDKLTIVVGSSWPADERLWREAFTPSLREHVRLIIVPHEPTPDNVDRLLKQFKAERLNDSNVKSENIVVDRKGILVELYSVADAAFIGGGFGAGVHSATEPATYGIPLACGPEIERSADARSLRDAGLLSCVSTVDELQEWLTTSVLPQERRAEAERMAQQWSSQRTGSADRLVVRLISLIME